MADTAKQSSPVPIILCALGLLAFLLAVIYPNYRSLRAYDRQIVLLKDEIALRQALAPIFRQLIEKALIAPSTQLKRPEKKMLDIENTGRLTLIFQEIAKISDMTLESVVPDAQALDQDNGRLLVEVVFRGAFANLQPLINTIVEHAVVDRIEKIHIRNTEENKWIKLSVSVLRR